jgi:hypothetical protein
MRLQARCQVADPSLPPSPLALYASDFPCPSFLRPLPPTPACPPFLPSHVNQGASRPSTVGGARESRSPIEKAPYTPPKYNSKSNAPQVWPLYSHPFPLSYSAVRPFLFEPEAANPLCRRNASQSHSTPPATPPPHMQMTLALPQTPDFPATSSNKKGVVLKGVYAQMHLQVRAALP